MSESVLIATPGASKKMKKISSVCDIEASVFITQCISDCLLSGFFSWIKFPLLVIYKLHTVFFN